MFCISKGLGAPVVSLLCGSAEFIKKARATRKLLGAGMRQCGIIAAPGIYALKHNVERLKEDADNAKYVAENLAGLKKAEVQKNVQSNIVMLNIANSGLTYKEYAKALGKAGLLVHPIREGYVRLVFYKGVTRDAAVKAVEIIKKADSAM
jgi:threonine aldolase